MVPVIRISDETYARMKKHAQPFEDTPDSIIAKALSALETISGDVQSPARNAPAARSDLPKLPQKEFRVPLLMTLLKFGGRANAKDVRPLLGAIVAPRLADGDHESVSTGDPRWWNATCWERNELVKEGLLRSDSERGVWELSEAGKKLPASLHRREYGDDDRLIAHGTLHEMAERYWRRPLDARPFVMVGDTIFDPILLRRCDELELSVRSSSSLKNAGIIYIGELVQRSEEEMLRTPIFGRKGLSEITNELGRFGLKIGFDLPGGAVAGANFSNI
ncbi:DNA-directed RNA polymerase subunit alpha C-terminal domain-containing protein [Bradyrhizobium symbiodeficiens]|uniref:DNA-directed RNA polymerase subunit alpha C-terminal domain-containing protein n=1 Tax=Bradyrhizobium symbiodeficiens TaxID=1404367 RepID=A0A6G9A0M8_9BRAD|nr:DNA-directed RNA polymerase subunit alpha C-terminal domain-containing protein [Bradyrhizobium symbiodeficiens]QIP05876.1 hypothetical protein HAV00_06305 [Bradyrhizobium symbiodeficiens]